MRIRRATSEPVRNGPGKERPKAVAQEAQEREEDSQEQNLPRNISARGVHKLRKESKEKERGLRVQHVYDNALRKDAAQLDAGRTVRELDRFLTPQLLHAEINQIRRAEILHDSESERRGHQQG